jgi:hypothetical protein
MSCETEAVVDLEETKSGKRHKLKFIIRGDNFQEIEAMAKKLRTDIQKSLPEDVRTTVIRPHPTKLGGDEGLEFN